LSSSKKDVIKTSVGLSLKDKLSLARKELDCLQSNDLDDSNSKIESSTPQIESSVKFHLTGRCNRKDNKYITKAFYVLDGLDKEIKQYCNGGDVALFNYLMHLGLNEIKRRDGHSFDEISSVEEPYLK
jgi:hypothetical protein